MSANKDNIPDEELNKIKAIPLESIFSAKGFSLKRHGSNLKCRCPFSDHKDENESLIINLKTNLYKCFGCNRGGDGITFLREYDKLDFIEACKRLRESFLPALFEPKNGEEHSAALDQPKAAKQENLETAIDITEPKYQKALKLVVGHYHNNLKSNKEPVDYLLKRKIIQGELIEEFQAGYSNGNLIEKLGLNDQPMLTALEETGIIKNFNGSFREHFRGCLVFPVIDENGIITEVYGRAIDNTKEIKHLYLPGIHRGMFNKRALISREIFLCESIIDALSLMTLGFKNVTASFGTNGFTEEMLNLFDKSEIEKVYICYDNDKAGDRATDDVKEKLQGKSISTYRIILPVKDVNDFIRKTENPDENFRELIKEAVLLWRPKENLSILAEKEKDLWEKINGEYHFTFAERIYIVRGLENNKDNTTLKVFLRLNYKDKFHIDNNLDLFNAKAVSYFIKGSSFNLEIEDKIVREDISKMTISLDSILAEELEKKKESLNKQKFFVDIRMQQEAISLSKDDNLLIRFLDAIEASGVVGENINAFVCFLSTLSRYSETPLHVMIQSESSSGKSTLLNLITSFVPPEDLLFFTQLSPQSLFYVEEGGFKHKVLAIAEIDGMSNIFYPIKQLMSENKLSNLSTGTNPKTGEHKSNQYSNEGPIVVLFTCPREGVDEEVENRCIILTLNESKEQTERIQKMQRLKHSFAGVKMIEDKNYFCSLFQHFQREIKIRLVYNPYANDLDFNSENHRTRRHNQKFLTLMDCVTLFFFGQREIIERGGKRMYKTHLIDVALTQFLARRMFAKSLDELPPQTRNFLNKIEGVILQRAKEEKTDYTNIWIYRRQMREITSLSNTRVHEHSRRLLEFDYFASRRDLNGLSYRLIYSEQSGEPRSILQLADLEKLKKKASKKEREEYESFIPKLKIIYKTLDSGYINGEY